MYPEAEVREMEIKMIKALKPRFNMGESGDLKRKGYGQRTQPYRELKKVLRQVIREELKVDYLRPPRQKRDPQEGVFKKWRQSRLRTRHSGRKIARNRGESKGGG